MLSPVGMVSHKALKTFYLGSPIAFKWLIELIYYLSYPYSMPIYIGSALGWMIDYLSTSEMTSFLYSSKKRIMPALPLAETICLGFFSN